MDKNDYLQALRKNLINMEDDDKDDVIRYYMEYFAEAGSKNEQSVIDELGDPVILARKLSAESAIKDFDEFEKEQNKSEGNSEKKKKNRGIRSFSMEDEAEDKENYYESVANGNGRHYVKNNAERTSYSSTIEKTKKTGKNLFAIILALCTFPMWFPLGIVGVVFALVAIIVAVVFVLVFVMVGIVTTIGGIVSLAAGIFTLFNSLASGVMVIGGGLAFIGFGIIFALLGKALIKSVIKMIVKAGKRKTRRM